MAKLDHLNIIASKTRFEIECLQFEW